MLNQLLDLIFPPSADELLMRSLSNEEIFALISPSKSGSATALFPYRTPIIRTLIWRLKYKDDAQAARLLGGALSRYLSQATFGARIVLPIPLSRARLRERGYNQVARFARHALRGMPECALREDVLLRAHFETSQTKLDKSARAENVRDAFIVRDPEAIAGRDVIILDDVLTTGATLREAEKVVRDAGARSVALIALAH